MISQGQKDLNTDWSSSKDFLQHGNLAKGLPSELQGSRMTGLAGKKSKVSESKSN